MNDAGHHHHHHHHSDSSEMTDYHKSREKHSSKHSRGGSRIASSFGENHSSNTVHLASAFTVFSSALGLIILLIGNWIAATNNEPAKECFTWIAVFLAALSFGAGLYASIFQIYVRSHRAKKRLRIGFLLLTVVTVFVIHNIHQWYQPLSVPEEKEETEETQKVPVKVREPDTEDTSLYKPGWYGEITQYGLQIILSSYAENAKESREFNRRIKIPVSYAVLTVINRTAKPIVLPVLTVFFVMNTGTSGSSLPVRPLLLVQSEKNRDLLPRLVEPLTIPPGGMMPAIPVCTGVNFPWSRVRAVKVRIGKTELFVPGRMVTAAEKQEMMEAQKPLSPEAGEKEKEKTKPADWYKGL